MTVPTATSIPSRSPTKTNLRRLFILRSLMITGVLAILVVGGPWLDIDAPKLPLGIVAAAMLAINIFTWLRLRMAADITATEFFIQLIADVTSIAAILYFLGGATNPFAWFFLIPIMISATVLQGGYTWSLVLLTTACYSILMFYNVSLGQSHMSHDHGFQQHVFGMWFGFVLSAGLIAWFIVGMANTLRERDQHLAEAREKALRDERLVALGTLAAGAAHEMGTPLATMAVVTHELERDYDTDEYTELRDRMRLLRSQVDRCKEALSVMSASAGEARAESGHPMQVRAFIDDVASQWQSQQPDASLALRVHENVPAARILAERTLTQALVNILNNAADAAPDNIELEANWDNVQLDIAICDRGPGFSALADTSAGRTQFSTKEHGLGIGLLLARATINRLGGELNVTDRSGGGACAHIRIPLLPEPGTS